MNIKDLVGQLNIKTLEPSQENELKDLSFKDKEDKDKRARKVQPDNNSDKPNYKDLKIRKVDSDKNGIKQRKLMEMNVIPRHPGVSLFIGSIGSGKSNLIVNLLTRPEFYGPSNEITKDKKPFFDVVFLLTGADDDAYDVLVDKNIIKEQHIKYDPTSEDIQRILDIQMKTIKKDGLLKAPKVLVILEDIVDNKKLMNSKSFRSLFIKPRQHSLSVWIAGQYINLIPKGLRQQAINLFIFPQNRAGDEIICEQFCPNNLKKNEFLGLITQCTEIREGDSHPFLHINRRCKNSERFRRNLDKIISL
jgi:hypothetical protein